MNRTTKIQAALFAAFAMSFVFTQDIRSANSTEWSTIKVPGAWETNAPKLARGYHGFAWYRTWLKPHDSFFTKHERDLFAESVTLTIRDLADAHELFVNGIRIGGGGKFPPNFD